MVNQFGISINNTSSSNFNIIYLPSIFFSPGSYEISSSNKDRLLTIAAFLSSNTNISMKIIGSSDVTGDSVSNKELGLRRSNAVINYLHNNYNIDKSRLKAETVGEENSFSGSNKIKNSENYLKSNMSLEINRRVDFKIIY